MSHIYSTDQKAVIRARIWRTLKPMATDHILLMPSDNGQEVDVATTSGASVARMHLVERKKEIACRIQESHPDATVYPKSLVRACEEMHRTGFRVARAHLDFTACINPKLLRELEYMFNALDVFNADGMFAITAQRGREQEIPQNVKTEQWWRNLWESRHQILLTDLGRLGAIVKAISGDRFRAVDVVRWGAYDSVETGLTMLWLVVAGRRRRYRGSGSVQKVGNVWKARYYDATTGRRIKESAGPTRQHALDLLAMRLGATAA